MPIALKQFSLCVILALMGVTSAGAQEVNPPLALDAVSLEDVANALVTPATPLATALPPQATVVDYLSEKFNRPKAFITRIVQAAYHEGLRVGVHPLTILAIIEKESSFRATVVSAAGAIGLMQVMPQFHSDKLPPGAPASQLAHPETNIRVGVRILSEYLRNSQGDLQMALRRYSGGASAYHENVTALRASLDKGVARLTE